MQFEELRAVERWAPAHQLNLFTRRRTSQGRPSNFSTLFIGVYLSLYTNLYLSRCWAPHDGALVSPLPDVELLTHLSLPLLSASHRVPRGISFNQKHPA